MLNHLLQQPSPNQQRSNCPVHLRLRLHPEQLNSHQLHSPLGRCQELSERLGSFRARLGFLQLPCYLYQQTALGLSLGFRKKRRSKTTWHIWPVASSVSYSLSLLILLFLIPTTSWTLQESEFSGRTNCNKKSTSVGCHRHRDATN